MYRFPAAFFGRGPPSGTRVSFFLCRAPHFQSRRASSAPKEKRKPLWPHRQRGVKMVLTVLALLAYAAVMNSLGFLVSTIFFLVFLLKVIEPQRWSVALLGSLAASVAFYGVFELGLQSQLPKGPFQIF
ncbi:MAG: tripartite tricarboxylate transporter TctB family protein [Deltaproteobacteria bacterium]|nr:tripartite tricarboxylate transporter TctB family protein [Deltaproteobacteria bacterium]